MFKIRRQDGDILVISQKFVDQLRSLPEKQLSSTWAQVRNLHGHYTTLDALITSNLHIRVIQQRLTPNLAASVPIMEKELKYALDVEMPKCDGKSTSSPQHCTGDDLLTSVCVFRRLGRSEALRSHDGRHHASFQSRLRRS